jgi:peptide/nickel transport system substrate-binding protein
MQRTSTNRRDFLRLTVAGAAASALLVACQQSAPATPTTAPAPVAPAASAANPTAAAAPAVSAAATPTGAAAPAAAAAQPTATTASAAAASPAAAPGAAAVPAGLKAVARNRTVITAGLGGEAVGGYTDVDNQNPYLPGFSRSGYNNGAAEPLFHYMMLSDKFIPWLAESYTFNADYTEVAIKLRPDVTWSDGQPFTTKDVAFTANLLKSTPELLNASEYKRRIKDVQVTDDFNMKFILNGRDPQFVFEMLTFRSSIGDPILPEHVWTGQDAKTFKFFDLAKGWPLATGPYKLVASTVEQKIWDLDPNWWAAKTGFKPLPAVERMIWLPGMNEITMAQMSITNDIDIAFSMTPQNMKLIQAQNPKVVTNGDQPPFGFTDWWPIGLGVNTQVAPWNDPEVRWALSYAINRDELIQFAFQGTTTALTLPYPNYPGIVKFEDGVKDLLTKYDTTKFDPKQTDAIMTKKGYAKGADGFWAKDGKTLALDIVTFPQHPSCTPAVPIVTQQLRRAGFNASFQLPADFATRITTGAATGFIWGHGGSLKDPFKTLDLLYHSRWVKPTGQDSFGNNLYRWDNKDFSDIVDQMGKLTSDDPQMATLFHKAMEIWLPNLPDVMLVQTVIQCPLNTTYWTNWPRVGNLYADPGLWFRTASVMWENLKPVS